jgi:CspA family cold shock protein
MTGKVKRFDVSQGYGYIDAGTGKDVFVYYQDITGTGFQNLLTGDQVEFAVSHKPSGPVASEVTRL